jgi:hypothetical protein
VAWKNSIELICDNQCGAGITGTDRENTIAVARALGWSYGEGLRHSGEAYEGSFCGGCRGVQMRRIGRRAQGYDDTPLW